MLSFFYQQRAVFDFYVLVVLYFQRKKISEQESKSSSNTEEMESQKQKVGVEEYQREFKKSDRKHRGPFLGKLSYIWPSRR